jgi:hypothetical protein
MGRNNQSCAHHKDELTAVPVLLQIQKQQQWELTKHYSG